MFPLWNPEGRYIPKKGKVMERKRVKKFGEWKKRRHRDGSVERVHRLAADTVRDWQTDAYRSQSARRESDVVQQ
jgi:hypothetical protein